MEEVKIQFPLEENGGGLTIGAGDVVAYQVKNNPKEIESINNALLSESQCNGSNKIQIQPFKKIPNGSPNSNRKPMISLTHLPRRPPVDIDFTDLSYSVSEGRKRGFKTILKGVSGKFKCGELTAIMGPSGAGKSTLMNILAGYRTSNLTGSVLINGKERNLRRFRKMSCYIMQDDCLTPHLTVKEAMTVSADLKLGKNLNKSEKAIVIDEILDTLGLIESKDTFTTVLSGGQRKRLSIALELINNPPVLFFDEPTSGLDSSSCFQCISLLKNLARGGRTIICTIHQPSARIFEMFDNLYMMGEGQCLYKGVVSGLVPFLSSMSLSCPSYHNPADYVMEVACGEHGDYVQKLVVAVDAGRCQMYSLAVTKTASDFTVKSNITNDITKDLSLLNTPSISPAVTPLTTPNGLTEKPNSTTPSATCTTSLLENSSENLPVNDKTSFPTTGVQQFWILLKRTIFCIMRDQTLTRMRLIAHIIIGILLGLIYYNIGNDASKVMSNAGCLFFIVMFTMFSGMMPTILTFPLEMSVFVREHLNYWYSLKSYYFAKTFADIPFQILLTASFMMGVYYLTSQPMDWIRFAMMLLITVLTALVSQSIGLLVGAAFNVEAGVFLGPISIIPMVLFSGFFANLNDLPKYLSWLSYVSYVRYSFEGCMIAVYGMDREKLECNKMYCHYKYPKTFLSEMSMTGDLQTYCIDIAALLGYFLIVRLLSYFALRIRLMANH